MITYAMHLAHSRFSLNEIVIVVVFTSSVDEVLLWHYPPAVETVLRMYS